MADVLGFEPPVGLALSGPSERLLPLEPESGDALVPEPGPDEPPHRVH
jgi:hypothetical protein